MSAREERERFLLRATGAGLPYHALRALLRHAKTLQRLAEAQCNGDYPADNGQRETFVCPACEMGWAPASFKRAPGSDRTSPPVCPDCRTQMHITALLLGSAFAPVFGGDPRGYVLKIRPLAVSERDAEQGHPDVIGVPS